MDYDKVLMLGGFDDNLHKHKKQIKTNIISKEKRPPEYGMGKFFYSCVHYAANLIENQEFAVIIKQKNVSIFK